MSVLDYEAIACGTLGVKHVSSPDVNDVAVGTFKILNHPEIFDGLASMRQIRAKHILFNSPELTEGLSHDDCCELGYYHIPHNLTAFLDITSKMPAFHKEHSKCRADEEAYEACLTEIERMMEQYHPGSSLKRDSGVYQLIAADMAQDYKQQTGKNIHLLGEKVLRWQNQLRETYGQREMMFFKEYWKDCRFPCNADGYFQYLSVAFPQYAQMLQRDVLLLVPTKARERHTYIVGGTGSGKSELIKLMAYGDILIHESAVVVIDPHGDLVEQISKLSPLHKEFYSEHLIYIDPFMHSDHTPVLNPLDCTGASAQEREVIADQLVCAFEEMLKGDGGTSLSLNMRTLLKPCLLVLLDEGDTELLDLQAFLSDDRNEAWVSLGQKSPRRSVRSFFETEFSNTNFSTTKESLRNKLQSLFNASAFCDIVNGKSTVDLKAAIDSKKIILFNLSKGKIGPDASEALGRFIIASIKGIALRRADKPENERVPVHLYIDECHNYIGPSIHTILTEARKYKLHLTMAQQVAGDGMSPELKQIVFNNAQVNFAGRTKKDSNLPKIFNLEIDDFQRLEVGQFYCRIGNGPSIHMQALDGLMNGGRNMEPEQWTQIREQQKQYYRSLVSVDDVQASAPKPSHKVEKYQPDLV